MPMQQYSAADALAYARFVDVAYQMYGDDPHNLAPAQPAYFPQGWRLLLDLTVEPVLPIQRDTEFIGFVAQSTTVATEYALVFRGTASDLDWVGDMEIWARPFTEIPNGGHTEAGFTDMYRSLRARTPGIPGAPGTTTAPQPAAFADAIKAMTGATQITVCGHSLGGALAILAAAVLGAQHGPEVLDCYTYAAPMVGNGQFAGTYNTLVGDSYRIFNKPDLVPKVPGTEFGYSQVLTGIEVDSLNDPGIRKRIACFHSLATYRRLLGDATVSLGDCAAPVGAAQAVLPNGIAVASPPQGTPA